MSGAVAPAGRSRQIANTPLRFSVVDTADRAAVRFGLIPGQAILVLPCDGYAGPALYQLARPGGGTIVRKVFQIAAGAVRVANPAEDGGASFIDMSPGSFAELALGEVVAGLDVFSPALGLELCQGTGAPQ